MTGIEMITEKRMEHFKLGFNAEHDSKFQDGQLIILAHYIMLSNNEHLPKEGWSLDYVKQIFLLPRLEQLAIVGSLIAAEIDRRQLKEKENDNSTTP
jgi:hypothetical protein